MSAEDVLVDSVHMGWVASESETEKRDMLMVLKVFKDVLLSNIRDGDESGLFAATALFRNGKALQAGVVLVLQDRVVLGWMKGLFKKPVAESVPLSTMSEVKRGPQTSSRGPKVKESITFQTAGDKWEMWCSPDVAPDAALYQMLTELLAGELTTGKLPALPE
jgi:hypothetical protein